MVEVPNCLFGHQLMNAIHFPRKAFAKTSTHAKCQICCEKYDVGQDHCSQNVDMRKDFTNFLGACWFARSCHFQDFNLNASRRTYGAHHSHIDFSTVDYLGSGKLECERRGGVIVSFSCNCL